MLKIIFTMISYLRNYFPILVVFLSCLISRFWYHFFCAFFFANFMYLRNNGCNGANNFLRLAGTTMILLFYLNFHSLCLINVVFFVILFLFFFLYQLFYSSGGVGVRQPSFQLLILVLTKSFNSKFTHAIIVNFFGRLFDCFKIVVHCEARAVFWVWFLLFFLLLKKQLKGGTMCWGHILPLDRGLFRFMLFSKIPQLAPSGSTACIL